MELRETWNVKCEIVLLAIWIYVSHIIMFLIGSLNRNRVPTVWQVLS